MAFIIIGALGFIWMFFWQFMYDKPEQSKHVNEEELAYINQDEVVPDETGKTIDGKGTSLDLSWLAYEIVSVNIPLVHSHQEGECNKQMELLLHNHLCDEPEPDEIE